MRKPGYRSPKRPNVDSEINEKMAWRQARKQIEISSPGPQKAVEMGPEIDPRSVKIMIQTPRVHPAAPMVLPGAPEVPKWSPSVRKWRHQGPEMATARAKRGWR